MYRALMKLDHFLTRVFELILTVIFMLILFMVFYQVVLRYLFNESIFGTAEVYTMLFAYASSLGVAVMLRSREHIKISVFIDRLPDGWRKIVLTIDYLLIAVFSYFVTVKSIPWLISIRTFKSMVTGIPRSVESITIPIGFILIIFYCIVNILSLYLNPEETAMEFASGEAETRQALGEAKETERRMREQDEGQGE